jgi:hypothetical protein
MTSSPQFNSIVQHQRNAVKTKYTVHYNTQNPKRTIKPVFCQTFFTSRTIHPKQKFRFYLNPAYVTVHTYKTSLAHIIPAVVSKLRHPSYSYCMYILYVVLVQ